MLQVSLLRHASEQSDSVVVTKKIRIDDRRQILLQIDSKKPHAASLVEGAIVDTVADSGKAGETAAYFSFVLDRLNRHLRATVPDLKVEDVRVFLAAIDGDDIHFSVLGHYNAYLIRGGRITDIAEGMASTASEFSYVSSGSVKHPDSLYVANIDLLDYLTEEDVTELATVGKDDEKRLAIENLIRREAGKRAIDCIALTNANVTDIAVPAAASGVEKAAIAAKNAMAKAAPIARDAAARISGAISEIPAAKKAYDNVRNHPIWKNEKFRAAAFGAGVVVCAFLLYATIAAIFQQKTDLAVPEEYKNRLIEAQVILDKAGKDLANKEVFKANLKKAEDLIFEVRGKNVYMNDVKRLLDSISILKKQMNGIESFDPKAHEADYAFPDKKFGPVGAFEIQKKYYFVGKTSLAGPFVKGAETKVFPYPDGEEAVSSDASAEGVIYVLTKTNRVLKFYKGEFSYVNVDGQKSWEAGRAIKTFNGNLYVLSSDGTQIYKHKPSVNGFSSKSSVLVGDRTKKPKILDFGLDGGFYVVRDDLMMDKIFTVPDYSERSIMLNALPDDYALSSANEIPKFYAFSNANYLYLILANRIWVFEPDSRDYRNIKSVRYVGQIEVVESPVRSVFVPKDGTVVATTDTGVYQIRFEVSDGKLVIR
ncbi:MAG: hypothetical protein QMC36_05470 [Patescibacteria group bacterium]